MIKGFTENTNRRKIFIIVAIVLVVAGAVTGATLGFISIFKNITLENTINSLNESSELYKSNFEISLRSKFAMGDLAATRIPKYASKDEYPEEDLKYIHKTLSSTKNSGDFFDVLLVDESGKVVVSALYPDNESRDISNRDYFADAKKNDQYISDEIYSPMKQNGEYETETRVIVLSCRLRNEKGVFCGILVGLYEVRNASLALLPDAYMGEGYGFVVINSGEVILTSKGNPFESATNIYDDIFKNVSKKVTDKIKSDISDGKSGSLVYKIGKSTRIVSYNKSEFSGFYVFSFAPHGYFDDNSATQGRLVLAISCIMIALFGLVLAYVLYEKHRQQRSISMANKRYVSLLSNINGGVITTNFTTNDDEVKVIYATQGFFDLIGYTPEEFKRQFNSNHISLVHKNDVKKCRKIFFEQVKKDHSFSLQYRIVRGDGSILWVLQTGAVLDDKKYGPVCQSTISDITPLMQREEFLKLSDKRFKVAIAMANGCVFEYNLKIDQYMHLENSKNIFDKTSEQIERDVMQIETVNPVLRREALIRYFYFIEDFAVVKDAYTRIYDEKQVSFEARVVKNDGTTPWCKVHLSLLDDANGVPASIIGIITNIDEMKHKMLNDSLTGLYNKTAIENMVNSALQNYSYQKHAMLMLDIDNFKGVNDTLGHIFGDVVLIDIGAKMKNLFFNRDILGRVGGDEFVAFMPDIKTREAAIKRAEQICATFRKTYSTELGDYRLSCSVGIVFREDERTFIDLFKKADAALYRAKASGKDMYYIYDNDEILIDDSEIKQRHLIENLNQPSNIKDRVFELLYNSTEFKIGIDMILALIGQTFNTSRVYVFECGENNRYMKNTFEWCNDGAKSEIANLQYVDISNDKLNYLSLFNDRGVFSCPQVSALPFEFKNTFADQNVLSVLQVAFRERGEIKGFLGVDECRNVRIWTGDELDMLTYVSKLMGTFISKRRLELSIYGEEELKTRTREVNNNDEEK